jgi:hypothetical protein
MTLGGMRQMSNEEPHYLFYVENCHTKVGKFNTYEDSIIFIQEFLGYYSLVGNLDDNWVDKIVTIHNNTLHTKWYNKNNDFDYLEPIIGQTLLKDIRTKFLTDLVDLDHKDPNNEDDDGFLDQILDESDWFGVESKTKSVYDRLNSK